nr:type II/IV secretion system protein [Desulfobacterales bacterium]
MKKRIGDILVGMGVIDRDQLEKAVEESKKTGEMIGDVLLRLDWITEEQLQMAMAVQSGAHILSTAQVDIDRELISKIPLDFVTNHRVFPFSKEDNTIKVAMVNPFDVVARDKLARMTGCRIIPYIASKEWLSNAIEVYYKTGQTIDNEIERLTEAARQGMPPENQIVKLADLLIEKGYILGASDIHVVPDTNLVRVYYRIDGILHQEYLLPKNLHQALTTRYKVMGDIDISNPNIPHDGRIKYQGSVEQLDLRVSIFPTHLGETLVLRILLHRKVVGDLKRLGFEKDDLARFLKALRRPYGLILTTGPTGSGKTTTLYSALTTINSPNVSVMTIEDPIEYVIPTIRQTAVNPKAGLTFGNALRAAMRQDPDIILVGEIRDRETAELALRASITGHLVLSTLHTNDSASAITRLLDLGVSPSMLASSLTMVLAQRLVRKVCPRCSVKAAPGPREKEIFVRNGLKPPSELPRSKGCDNCHNSGYKGRTGIYEVLYVDREMEELIFAGAPRGKIEEAAVRSGTSLMFKQGLKKVIRQI